MAGDVETPFSIPDPSRQAGGSGTGAFDDHHPPDEHILDTCVHVGFCLPSCPTYLLWGEEMDSPRGRITLMQVAGEPGSRLTDEMVLHWDRCLGCMACVTACPAGVRYEKLIEATRPQVERNYRRPLGIRLFRGAIFALFTHPARLRTLLPFLRLYHRLGLGRVLRPLLRPFPRLRVMARLAPSVPKAERLPELTAPEGERKGRVGLLQGCVQRVIFPQVNEATARVLAAEGWEVFAPAAPRCCGALELHSGLEGGALRLAKQLIEVFEDCDLVAVNAAGCGSSMKDYRYLLRDDARWAERAAAFSAKVRDVSEVLAANAPVASRQPVRLAVAYHDACHLAHAQGIRTEPRRLLGEIPGLELLEPAEWEICCGSAGIYNLTQPEAGEELGRRKAANLAATGAEAIVAANPGCILQIAAYLEELGTPLPIYHPVELIDHSIRGGKP